MIFIYTIIYFRQIATLRAVAGRKLTPLGLSIMDFDMFEISGLNYIPQLEDVEGLVVHTDF